MRILHLLHRSVPGTHGYAIRSRQIVKAELQKGLNPIVITSPSQAPKGNLDSERSELIDGIRYFRTCNSLFTPTIDLKKTTLISSFLRVIQNIFFLKTALRVANKYRPDVIHSHSPFTCGIIANIIGHREMIPTVYEVRGLWEDSQTNSRSLTNASFIYKGVRFLENRALMSANACCVISESLEKEILSRGVGLEKIAIIPNGVDVKTFVPGKAPNHILKKLGLEKKITIGYIGSLFHYEGLDLMIKAMNCLRREFPNIFLVIVGDGEMLPILKKMSLNLGLTENILFTGRVPHKKITDFYRLSNFFILPRRKTRATQLVTPLKPLEIMSMGKAVIATDIGGHREIIENGFNGFLFKADDLKELTSKCRTLILNKKIRMRIGQNARRWVEENRDWSILVDRYINLYSHLTRN